MPCDNVPLPSEAPSPVPDLDGTAFFSTGFPLWLWLVLVLVAGIGLKLLSHLNFLLFHVLVELFSIVLAATVFTIGWNARRLVQSPFLLVLAIGFLPAGLIDLLHTLTYKGMGIFPDIGSNLPTQFWIASRGLEAITFVVAASYLGGRRRFFSWRCLGIFSGAALLLTLSIWPLRIFPACYVEGVGLTPFKIAAEYLICALLALTAGLFWRRWDYLGSRQGGLLLAALFVKIASELSFTLYFDPYGTANFVGHLLKLITVILVYHALVEGTLRAPYGTLFRELVSLNRSLDNELKSHRQTEARLLAANREFSLLYKTTRILHSTLHLDTLVHLILSLATAPEGGGFRRAILLILNERTRMLQGMLGVDRESAKLVLPLIDSEGWQQLHLDETVRAAQRNSDFNRLVIKQRLPLTDEHSPPAQACLERRVIVVDNPDADSGSGRQLAAALGLEGYACALLAGRDQRFGVLLVEFSSEQVPFSPEQKRFFELFSGQAAVALENARLLHRLEVAHRELREVQEQLIQGEKLAVLGEMAAQVAHELKNPLVSVGGFAQRLAKLDLGNERAGEYAEIIAREVRRLEEMLGNILAFSKKQMVCLEDCDLNELLYEVLSLELEPQQRGNIELLTEIQAPLPGIAGDCRQLRQVVLNLLANARQAMPKGGRITLRAGPCTLRGEEGVVIEVEDTGGGIPAEIMRNIFNPFFSTHPKGTGLGLSISHRIVEQHHGEIEVFNCTSGACFIVRLPMRPPKFMMR